MSRAYRIRVRESLRRVIRAKDHVSSQLEILEILPAPQMAELLAAELEKRGFQRSGAVMVRREGDMTISIDADGHVTVTAESEQNLDLQGERKGQVYDDVGPSRQQAEQQLREELRAELEQRTSEKQEKLQRQITDQLEGVLQDIRGELDQVVNRATAEALKQKAAQIGEIQEISEDSETGSLTIVVEV